MSRHAARFLRYMNTTVTATLFLAAATSCTSSKKSETPEAKPTESAQAATPAASETPWPEKMKSLSKTLSDLLPLVVSRTKFNDPKNDGRIETDTHSLRTLAHSLKSGSAPNSDPSMKIMSGLFEEDIERALDSLRSGNREYARQILKDTTSYCIYCHTQTNNGPNFPKLDLAINAGELPLIDQAEFYAATRQFDRALGAYEAALKDENLAKLDPFEWEQSARAALAILVRVKGDPKAALQLLTKIQTPQSLPASTKTAITQWRKSVQDWSKEKKPKAKKPDSDLEKADELIKVAQKHQEFPLDHSQDIVYFRAAGLLHDYLQANSVKDERGAKALYLAGIAAEATRDMNFWTLHETYYEQCIRILPHTQQAQSCFERLKDSITLGYSGSGGIRIPPEVNRRLDSFKVMAAAEDKSGAKPAETK